MSFRMSTTLLFPNKAMNIHRVLLKINKIDVGVHVRLQWNGTVLSDCFFATLTAAFMSYIGFSCTIQVPINPD